MLELKLRVLKPPPNGVKCAVEYSIPSETNPLYRVCIANSLYHVYDAVLLEPSIEKAMKSLESKLYDLLVESFDIVEDLRKLRGFDTRLIHIAERQLIGYGLLEPFFMDPDIANVHVLPGKPVQVIHRVYGRLKTNIVLSNEEVREYAMRLAAAAGKPVSEATPLLSFVEPRYEARVTVIYQSDVTMKKSMVVDIRKPTEKPWTILKLIHLGSLSFEEAAFLWLMVKYKVPIIIVGELFSGKTTLATALLALIPPGSRVMTIEDAPEIRIPAEYWTRTTTREFGEYKVSVFDLVKTSVRLSLDYIIIGEVRGGEAREWANAILLGHGAITTFHAETPEAALLRLVLPPISVDHQVINALNVFVKTNVFELRPGKTVFRHEVYIHEEARVTPLFIYDRNTDSIVLSEYFKDKDVFNTLKFLDRVVLARRVTRDMLREEYRAMIDVLRETYLEYSKIDPNLDTPSHNELPKILYSRLQEKLAR